MAHALYDIFGARQAQQCPQPQTRPVGQRLHHLHQRLPATHQRLNPVLPGVSAQPQEAFRDVTGGVQARAKQFRHLRGFLRPEEDEKLDELERLYRAKLELDCHYTLQSALRSWLYAHVPTSILLLAFLALHLFSVFWY